MASSSKDPNGAHRIIHIEPTLGALRALEQRLSQLKDLTQVTTPSSDVRGPRKVNRCDKLCRELACIRSAFTKIDSSGGKVVNVVNTLAKKVDGVLEEFQVAEGREALTDEQVWDKLRVVASGIADLKVVMPSVPDADPKASRTAQDEEDGKGLDFHNELPALYLGKRDEYGSVFSELLEGLDDRARQLLLLFAAFPVGKVIGKRVLKNWWYAESLPSLSANKAEEAADEILEELMKRCLIEAVRTQYRLVGFKMNPFVHLAVVTAAVEGGFFAFDRKGNPTVVPLRSSRGCLVSGRKMAPSLDVLLKIKRSQDVVDLDQLDLDRLQTLYNINEQYPDFELDLFLKLKNVKVLSLGQWQGGGGSYHIEVDSTEFLKGLKSMKGLRLLSLRGMSRVTGLPDVVCGLVNLVILDLKSCHNLEALPQGIGSLKKLTHLDISGCYLLDEMPVGIALLTELRVLKGFLISDNGELASETFKYLAGLKNLNKLSLHASNEDFPVKEDLVIFEKFPELKRLSISWGGRKRLKAPKDKAAVDSRTAPNTAENAGLEPESRTTKPRPLSVGTLPPILEVRNEDPIAAEPRSGADTDQTNNVNVVGGDAASKVPKQSIVDSQDIGEEPESATQGASEAESKSRNIADNGENEHVLDSNAVTGAAKQTVKTPEITEEPGAATEADPLDAGGSNKQHDVARQPEVMEDHQASRGLGVKQEGQTSGTAKGAAAKMLQKMLSKTAMRKPRAEAEDQAQESDSFKALEKLDLQCYPKKTAPDWLNRKDMKKLKRLYVRGGPLCSLGGGQPDNSWKVEILRLKFLQELNMTWEDLLGLFPELVFLEIQGCNGDKLVSCPSDPNGVWVERTNRNHNTAEKLMEKVLSLNGAQGDGLESPRHQWN